MGRGVVHRGPFFMPTTPLLTVANQLTISRMALTPVLVLFIFNGQFKWAFWTFVAAGLTDALDGAIARFGNQRTSLGAMLDPVADKLLLSSSFLVLTWADVVVRKIPVWLTVTALSRDAIILISVAVINLALGHRLFLPSLLGKVCTFLQVATAALVIYANAFGLRDGILSPLYWVTAFVTTTSAIHYVYLASTSREGTPS